MVTAICGTVPSAQKQETAGLSDRGCAAARDMHDCAGSLPGCAAPSARLRSHCPEEGDDGRPKDGPADPVWPRCSNPSFLLHAHEAMGPSFGRTLAGQGHRQDRSGQGWDASQLPALGFSAASSAHRPGAICHSFGGRRLLCNQAIKRTIQSGPSPR